MMSLFTLLLSFVLHGHIVFAATGTIDVASYSSFLCSNDACTTGSTINWLPSTGTAVSITDSLVTGDIWGERIGWVNLNPTGYGVTNDGAGVLGGYAWGQSTGWINFAPDEGGVSINATTGAFTGWAWAQNYGWIKFDCGAVASCIKTDWRPPACSDGVDNDSDGKTDYSTDPGCSSSSDTDETDAIIPPAILPDACPNIDGLQLGLPSGFIFENNQCIPEPTNTTSLCSDGIDNDADGLIDYPLDSGCASANDPDERNAVEQIRCEISGTCLIDSGEEVLVDTGDIENTDTNTDTKIDNNTGINSSANGGGSTPGHSSGGSGGIFGAPSSSFGSNNIFSILIPATIEKFITDQSQPIVGTVSSLDMLGLLGLGAGMLAFPPFAQLPLLLLFRRREVLEGALYEHETGTPIRGATVYVMDASGNPWSHTVTDDRGYFSCATLPSKFSLAIPGLTFAPHRDNDDSSSYAGGLLSYEDKKITIKVPASLTPAFVASHPSTVYAHGSRLPLSFLFYGGLILTIGFLVLDPSWLRLSIVLAYVLIARVR